MCGRVPTVVGMRIEQLDIEGLGSFERPVTVPLGRFDLASIRGPVGAGKSTMFDAITWALTGDTRAGLDGLVNDHCDTGLARVELTLGGERYAVTRTRQRERRTTVVIERFVDGAFEPVGSTAKDVTAVLGLSAELWNGTAMASQGDAGRFCRAEPGERRRLLAEMLDITRFDTARSISRDQEADSTAEVKATQSAWDAASVRAEQLADKIAEGEAIELPAADADIDVLNKEAAELDARLSDLLGEQRARQVAAEHQAEAGRARNAELGRARKAAADADAEVVAHRARIADLEAQLALAEKAPERLATITAKLDSLDTQAVELDAELDAVSERGRAHQDTLAESKRVMADCDNGRAELVERLEALGRHDDTGHAASCWVCDQDLDDAARARLEASIQATSREHSDRFDTAFEAAALAEVGLQQAKADRTEVRARIERLTQERRSTADDATTTRGLADTVIGLGDSLDSAQGRLDTLQERAAEAHRTVAELDASPAADQATPGPDGSDLVGEIEQVRAERAALGDQIAVALDARQQRAALNARLDALREQAAALKVELGDMTTRIEEATAEATRWKTATAMFSPSGVPAMMVAEAIPEIERVANDLLARLTQGRHRIEIRTQTATKSGTTRDTLDLVVFADGHERAYAACSGGERRRIDTATRIALARLLARRTGMDAGVLLLDEALDLFDEESGRIVVDALADLMDAGLFTQVLVVTHQDGIEALCPQHLTVTPSEQGSVLTWET